MGKVAGFGIMGTRSGRTCRWRLLGAMFTTTIIGASASCGPGTPAPQPVPPLCGAPDAAPPPLPAATFPLRGFFDLHAHPLSTLGFAGKLVYGGADIGATIPANPDCVENQPAKTLMDALGHDGSTHGGWGLDLNPADFFTGKFGVTNPCGDAIRQLVIQELQTLNKANSPGSDASGYDEFPSWPAWNDVTHQSMYVDWIQRAHQHGLNVMVALTVNSKTLADSVAGPGDGPDDDKASSDKQIQGIKDLVERHSDWMQIAYDSDELARIVSAGKLAIVLGLEVDNIGDFNEVRDLSLADVRAEVARLHDLGVRYLFPIHLIDNPFGGTAAYEDIFNLSNLRESGHFWNLACAGADENIGYRYQMGNPLTQTVELNPPDPATAEMAALMVAKLGMLGDTFDEPIVPTCPDTPFKIGMRNTAGLTSLGREAIQEMMRQGMMIDVDHMSQASVDDALDLAESVENGGYPLNSGHNTVRRGDQGSERSLTEKQYQRIGKLGGMAGVGGAGRDDKTWLVFYQDIAAQFGRTDGIGFGTDADGVSPLMSKPDTPRFVYGTDFPLSSLGKKSWDYNALGVAHYGLIADFVHGFAAVDGGAAVANDIQTGAQFFYQTWRRVEGYAAAHRTDAGVPAQPRLAAAPASVSKPSCPSGGTRDVWGVCVSANAKGRAPAETVAAPFDSAHGKLSLPAGAYLLGLAASGAAAPIHWSVFDVSVGSNQRRVNLTGRPGSGPAPRSSGGFRGGHFLTRIDAGAQVLVLHAEVGAAVTPLKGAFVAHAPGASAVSGTFMLVPKSSLSPVHGVRAFGDLGTFLASLRANRP